MGVLLLEPFGWGYYGGQGHLLLVPFLEPLGRTYKVICFLVAAVLGMEVLGRDANWGQLLLWPGLWLLSWCYNIVQDQLPLIRGLGPPGGSYNADWDHSPLVPGLWPLSKLRLTATTVCLEFVDLYAIWVKSALRVKAVHLCGGVIGKGSDQRSELGGGSQGITRAQNSVNQILENTDFIPTCICLTGSVDRECNKGTSIPRESWGNSLALMWNSI